MLFIWSVYTKMQGPMNIKFTMFIGTDKISEIVNDSDSDGGSGVPRGVVWGVQTPPPRNSKDIGGVFDRISKKNRRLDFLLQFTVLSYGCNLLNKGFF